MVVLDLHTFFWAGVDGVASLDPTEGGASRESSLSISIGLALGKKDAADTGVS